MRTAGNVLLSLLIAVMVGYAVAHLYNPGRREVFMDGFDRWFWTLAASTLATFLLALVVLLRVNR